MSLGGLLGVVGTGIPKKVFYFSRRRTSRPDTAARQPAQHYRAHLVRILQALECRRERCSSVAAVILTRPKHYNIYIFLTCRHMEPSRCIIIQAFLF